MKRALLVLLALPATALAQSTTTTNPLTVDATKININQCKGTQDPPRGTSDKLDVGLSFTLNLAQGKTFQPGGKYHVWASNVVPSVDPVDGPACETSKTGGTPYRGFVETDAVTATPTDLRVDLKALASKAQASGFDCTPGTTTTTTIYLCVEWVDTQHGNAANGWATGATLTLDLAGPATPPTNVNVTPGDGKLYVGCTGGDSASSSFIAAVTPSGGGTPQYSGTSGSCNITLGGLTNGTSYDVVVYGLDDAFNPSPVSAPQSGIPVQTDDFYDHYKNDHGRETGGCSTASTTAGLLSALGLLAFRRRKP